MKVTQNPIVSSQKCHLPRSSRYIRPKNLGYQ